MLNDILKIIGGIVAVGGVASGAAYGLFRVFATQWIETRFSQRLQAFKHQQNQELEHLRFRINTQFDRLTKLHQREFEVLPQVWALANAAYRQVFQLTSALRIEVDLDNMGDAQFQEFVDASRLSNWEKEELINKVSERALYYRTHMQWRDLDNAQNA